MSQKRVKTKPRFILLTALLAALVSGSLGLALSNQSQPGQAPLKSSLSLSRLDTKAAYVGSLRVDNALQLAPSNRPANPKPGQIYFDKTTKKFVYYDGNGFDTVATNKQIEDLASAVNRVEAELATAGKTTATATAPATADDDSNITAVESAKLNGQTGSYYTNADNVSSGTLADGRLSTNVTLQGNSFNGNGQIIRLDSNGAAGSIGLCLLSTNGGVAFQACPSGSGSGNISSGTSQTAGKLVKFDSASNHITDSIASESGSTITVSGTLAATNVTGNGSGLTSLTGANVTGNISGNAGTASALAANPTDCGANTYATTIAANGNLACGAITDGSLSANVTLQGNVFNGASQLVQLTAGGILPVLSGANLTNLNASSLSSGTVADGRLSANVPLLNASNTFSGAVNLTGGLQVSGAAASGNFLRGNGTSFVSSGIQAGDIPAGSANYIQNGSSVQSSANFNISGSGTIGTNLTVSSLPLCDTTYTDSNGLLSCNSGLVNHISNIVVHGHSYSVAGDSTGTSPTFDNWSYRLANMLHANLDNQAQGGAVLSWPNGQPVNGNGGYFKVLQDITNTRSSGPYLSNNSLNVVYYGWNDMAALGPSNFDTPFENSLRTAISRSRAGAVWEAESTVVGSNPSITGGGDGTIAYGGSGGSHWTAGFSNLNITSGTGYAYSSTVGDTATISVPSDFAGGTVAIGFSVNSGSTANWNFTIDGVSAGSLNTANTWAPGQSIELVKRLTGLSAGAHTIVVSVGSVTGAAILDYWQVEANPAPPVVLPLASRLYSYVIYGSGTPNSPWAYIPTDSDMTQINNDITSVAGEFDNHVVTVSIDSTINKQRSYYMADLAHLNPLGNSKVAGLIYNALQSMPISVDTLAQSSANTSRFTTDSVIFRNNNNSTSGFQIQGYGGAGLTNPTIFNVDTTNDRVGIGTTTPTTVLDMVAPNDGLRIASGASNKYAIISLDRTGAAGTEGIIGMVGSASNFFSGSAAGDLAIRNNANLLLGTSGSGKADLTISSTGSVTFQPHSLSTTAFQVQNTSSQSLLTVDTTDTGLLLTGAVSMTGGFLVGNLSTPSAPTVTNQGTAGAKTYTYTVTAYNNNFGETTASTATSTTTGNTTLNGTNFNRITWSAVAGARGYCVYRTASNGTPSTTGKIGCTSAPTVTLDDTGLAGSGASPTVNTSGTAAFTGTVLAKNTTDSTSSFQVQNAAGTTIFNVDTSGAIAKVAGKFNVNTLTTADSTAQLTVSTGATSGKGIVVQGVASQAADMFQVQKSDGTVLDKIDPSGNLTVQALTLTGHFISGGSATSALVNSNASTAATCTVSGNDTSGTITLTTGPTPLGALSMCTINFGTAYAAAPKVFLNYQNGSAAASFPTLFASPSTSGFSWGPAPNTALTGNTTYTISYFAVQ